MQHSCNRQQIRDVVLADQPGIDRRAAIRQDQREALAKGRLHQILGAHQRREIAPRRADGVAEDAVGSGFPRHLQTQRVIEIDHRRPQARPLEQFFLGRRVGFHGAVVVEMVAGEIGKHGDIDANAVHPPLFDTDGTGFQGYRSGPGSAELGQVTHQRRRLGRGEAGFGLRFREARTQRTDDGAGLWIDARQTLTDRGLAIGTGHGDQ